MLSLSRKSGYIWFLLVGFTLTTVVPAVLATANGPTWTVYHSWDGGHQYTRRGTLQWTGDSFQLDNEEFTKEQVSAMMEFGWYHVKIDTMNGDYVMATVPACNLRRANFKDEFTLLLPRVTSSSSSNSNNDNNNNNAESDLHITSLAYTPLISALAPKSCQDEFYETNVLPDTLAFTSKVHAILDTPGMKLRTVLPKMKPPSGLIWLTHPNAKKGSAGTTVPGVVDPEQDKAEQQQPFFIKYWYIILPLVLANFLPSAPENPPTTAPMTAPTAGNANDNAATIGSGATATTASSSTTNAAAVAGAAGSQQKASRRNKRG